LSDYKMCLYLREIMLININTDTLLKSKITAHQFLIA